MMLKQCHKHLMYIFRVTRSRSTNRSTSAAVGAVNCSRGSQLAGDSTAVCPILVYLKLNGGASQVSIAMQAWIFSVQA